MRCLHICRHRFFYSEELGVRSEEWWRRALELLLGRLNSNGMIPVYIARRDVKGDSGLAHVKHSICKVIIVWHCISNIVAAR